MKNILLIRSSARGEASVSNALLDDFLGLVKDAIPAHSVTLRDLVTDHVPALNPDTVGAIRCRPEQLSDEQRSGIALSETLLGELRDADIIAIGARLLHLGRLDNLFFGISLLHF